jgi:signal transduction histidine kinase
MSAGPAVSVPLASGDTSAGVLIALRNPDAPVFDEDNLQVAASFAGQAALAPRHAEAQAARHELEVFADRDRIPRDLHDHVIQRLFATGLAMHDPAAPRS